MEKAVTVLAPNGRRQTVKVNLNATVLQILEEVCKKQGLQPEKYDIKHHNKCLDTTTIIRFSGLPNNAQLELSEAVTERADGVVTLGIQCENGDRLTGDFDPGCNLYDVLCIMCPEQVDPETNPVVVYMRRMIYGETSFKETTLRSLGLTHGRAMLRLIHKSQDELNVQANISAPLQPRPVEEKLPEKPRDKPSVRKYPKVDSPPLQQPSPAFYEVDKPKAASPPRQLQKIFANDPSHEIVPQPVLKEKTVAEEEFIFVGPRNAMIFSQDTAEAIPSEDLPDDFFELTITDAKKLLKDLKKHRMELDNLPLQTSAWRSLLKSTDQLTRMNRYTKSIIRIHFPDQMILQGVFKPVDTVEMVFDFVRDYLENRDLDFYLYTTPPINILDRNSKLIEIDCVPNAVLHFGVKGACATGRYLKMEFLAKCTTASVASLSAARMRQESTRPPAHTFNDDENMSVSDFPADDVNVGASTSTGQYGYETYPPKVSRSTDAKFPKWFKPPK